MTALHLPGLHAMMVDITREFQTRVLIARRSLERPRGDYPNDHYRRDIDNKEQLIFNGRDYVKNSREQVHPDRARRGRRI
jgi:hypothetical protein